MVKRDLTDNKKLKYKKPAFAALLSYSVTYLITLIIIFVKFYNFNVFIYKNLKIHDIFVIFMTNICVY